MGVALPLLVEAAVFDFCPVDELVFEERVVRRPGESDDLAAAFGSRREDVAAALGALTLRISLISSRVKARHSPGCMSPSRIRPIAIRFRRMTLCSSLAINRRISRFLPSLRTISKTVVCLSFLRLRTRFAFAQPSDSRTPVINCRRTSRLGWPETTTS